MVGYSSHLIFEEKLILHKHYLVSTAKTFSIRHAVTLLLAQIHIGELEPVMDLVHSGELS